MKMTVDRLMTTHVVSIRENATVSEACRLLLRHHISGLPVVDPHGALAGIVTEDDLMDLLAEPASPEASVRDYMTRRCVTLRPTDSLLFALDQFREHGYRRLPVVDQEGRLIGIMARREFIRFIAEVYMRLSDRHELDGVPHHVDAPGRQEPALARRSAR